MNTITNAVLGISLWISLTDLRADNPTQTTMMEFGNTSVTVVAGAKPSPAETRVTELLVIHSEYALR